MRILFAAFMIGVAADVSSRSVSAAMEIMMAAVLVALLSRTRIGNSGE